MPSRPPLATDDLMKTNRMFLKVSTRQKLSKKAVSESRVSQGGNIRYAIAPVTAKTLQRLGGNLKSSVLGVFQSLLRSVLWPVFRGQIGAIAEEELLHLLFEKATGLGIHGAEAILVDEYGLLAQPILPSLLRDMVEDTLTQVTRIGLTVETLRLPMKFAALDQTAHVDSPFRILDE